MKIKTKIIKTPKGYIWHSATKLSKNRVEMKYIIPIKSNE